MSGNKGKLFENEPDTQLRSGSCILLILPSSPPLFPSLTLPPPPPRRAATLREPDELIASLSPRPVSTTQALRPSRAPREPRLLTNHTRSRPAKSTRPRHVTPIRLGLSGAKPRLLTTRGEEDTR
ncbi:hypothetical protein BaRGS_00021905 [Batillaria attramentaria]|uniref:Uncharacterized protein n=1 Tax=Batillaria attramentaria TaxID=370345 RepID=A0ABD0KIC6_9CAEN